MFKDLDADLYVLLFAKHSAKDLDPNIIFVQNPFQGQVTIHSELNHMMHQSRDKIILQLQEVIDWDCCVPE